MSGLRREAFSIIQADNNLVKKKAAYFGVLDWGVPVFGVRYSVFGNQYSVKRKDLKIPLDHWFNWLNQSQ